MLIGMQTSAYSPYQAYQAYSKQGRVASVAMRPSDDLNDAESPVKERIEQEKLNQEKKAEEKKASEKKEALEDSLKKADETKESEKAAVTSFTGYTDAQLQQMYREGRISYQDMNKEIADRKELREERLADIENGLNKTDDAIISSMVQKTDIGLLLPEDFTLDKDEKLGLSA